MKSIVRQAAEEYQNGNYPVAMRYYLQAAALLDEKNFQVNIKLCERKLSLSAKQKVDLRTSLEKIKVACVMDEFTFHCFAPECDLMPLTPDNAITELDYFNPDLLFIESAWRGKDDLWDRKIGTLSNELKGVLRWCRLRQIPTIFWNKEDPIHFETFLSTAQQFDYVFTTDIDCIDRYKAKLGHDRIYLLPFACQPKTHNPMESYQRKDAFCFAGAYYVRYPERARDLENYVGELPKYRPLEIYDRNYGKDDVNYQFPPEYQPYIVGTLPFNEIDKAYKGYLYSINLNSIKQSQTMFARRVFELLGSNTITVSNFSRGVRLMFGDLVITSDSGKEIVHRLENMDDISKRKFRLSGLRKVMLEHTYGRRFAYIANKALKRPIKNPLPAMTVFSLVNSETDYELLLSNFLHQTYPDSRLLIVLGNHMDASRMAVPGNHTIDFIKDDKAILYEFLSPDEWVAPTIPTDYYGPNYLLDLAIATQFCDEKIIGKSDRYSWKDNGIHNLNPMTDYRPSHRLSVRSSAVQAAMLPLKAPAMDWIRQRIHGQWEHRGFAIDSFNYCQDGRKSENIEQLQEKVDDLKLDTGMPVSDIINKAENIPPAEFDESRLPQWGAGRLMELIGGTKSKHITFNLLSGNLHVESSLPEDKHEYIYADTIMPIAEFTFKESILTYLDTTPGLDIQYVFIFLDEDKQRINHAIHTANRNHEAAVPKETSFIRFGIRIYGNGSSTIKKLLWGHQSFELTEILNRGQVLLLTNQYPAYDNLYRYVFVHSRVKAYREHGIKVDVFRLRENESTSYHEYQNVDIITGSQNALHKVLGSGRYKNILVHFLDPGMWEILKHYPNIKATVWIHGAEIQPWHRRDYNYVNDQKREAAKLQSDKRTAFWHALLSKMPHNLNFVFVSKYFAEETMEDLGFRLPPDRYTIIHNPIHTEYFSYRPKPAEQRKRILSIRPYSSRTYANDLSVKAILNLSQKPFFDELVFRMVGDGELFEETLEPLRKFPNIIIDRGFIAHKEIAALHKEYGIFLCPSRMDTQGVSRDEAMSSGLVPVTNAVAAVSEFVDDNCGILAGAEDSNALAEGICNLYYNPDLFKQLSHNAANRVRTQSARSIIIDAELALFDERNAAADDSQAVIRRASLQSGGL